MRPFLFPITGLLLAITPAALPAATITETYTLPTITGSLGTTGTNFAEFNPTLGTLTSVTVTIIPSLTTSGAGAADVTEEMDYGFLFFGTGSNEIDTSLIAGKPSLNGVTSAAITQILTDAASLLNFTGSGSVRTSVDAEHSAGTALAVSTFGTPQVVYTYTPTTVSAAPEPSAIALLGSGLAAAVFLRRRLTR